MKKIIGIVLAVALLAYMGWLPFHSTEISKLLPVKTVVVTKSGDSYTVDIDSGVKAVGNTLKEAIQAVREHAPGEVFFQTAENVVVSQEAAELLPEAAAEEAFRPSASILLTDVASPQAEELSDYLQARSPLLTRAQLQAELAEQKDVRVPLLTASDGGYRILE